MLIVNVTTITIRLTIQSSIDYIRCIYIRNSDEILFQEC